MNLIEAKRNLGKTVLYTNKASYLENVPYTLQGIITRINDQCEYIHRAELLDKNGNSIIYVNMEDIRPAIDIPDDISNALNFKEPT